MVAVRAVRPRGRLMTRRVAAVDCGTNSLRLLLADVDLGRAELTDVARRMEIATGQGVDKTGQLAPEALARTIAALREYADIIASSGAQAVRMVATSATRDADNAAEFVRLVKEVLGVAPGAHRSRGGGAVLHRGHGGTRRRTIPRTIPRHGHRRWLDRIRAGPGGQGGTGGGGQPPREQGGSGGDRPPGVTAPSRLTSAASG